MAAKKRVAVKQQLTPKQQVFVDEYLVDLNAKKAAIRAGYSARNADKIGSELLGKTRVSEAISKAMARRKQRTELKQDEVIRELVTIAFANMADYMTIGPDGLPVLNFSTLSSEQAAALAEVSVDEVGRSNKDGDDTSTPRIIRVKFKLHDKLSALISLGKHLGMFPTRLEHTGKNGDPIQTETVQRRVVIMMPDNSRGDANYKQLTRGSKS